MVTKRVRREKQEEKVRAAKRYEKHRRHNLVYAQPGEMEFAIVLDNLKPSFNIGKIFRSADAFGASEVHLVGTKYFDPAPAMGSFKWVPAVYHDDFSASYDDLTARGYSMYVLEPDDGEFLHRAALPEKAAFILGHEEFGVSFDKADFPSIKTLTIKQFGKVQSLNVSVAATVVMYEFSRQQVGR